MDDYILEKSSLVTAFLNESGEVWSMVACCRLFHVFTVLGKYELA